MAHHLFYIAQEAILNAVKHGKAALIQVQLSAPNGEGYRLTIRDNGTGVTFPLPNGSGMGIRIMKYRARMIGADLDIAALPEGGTQVVCRFGSKLRA